MNKPLKAAVVGTGNISKEHLSFLHGSTDFDPPENVQLVGVCDLSQVSAKYSAEQYGADQHFTDFETMIDQTTPDVVHILTPPGSHIPLASLALSKGAHVICEKPITSNAEDLKKLFATAEANDRQLMESHNYRFNDEIIALRQAQDEGRIGRTKEVEIRINLQVTDPSGRFGDTNMPSPIHQMPAGVIHDFTTHFSYLLLHLGNQPTFETTAAIWRNQSEIEVFKYDNLDAIVYGQNSEGPFHGRIRFDADLAPDTFAVTVRGTNGFMETDLFQPYSRTVVPRPGGSQLSPIVNHLVNGTSMATSGLANLKNKLLQKSPYHGLHRMLQTAYENLAEGKPFPVTPLEILAASEFVDQLLAKDAQK